MEDLGFFPYPSSFSTGFADEILDPGPTSFFLKDPHGEDVLLAQGLDQLQNKLGLSLFEEENRSLRPLLLVLSVDSGLEFPSASQGSVLKVTPYPLETKSDGLCPGESSFG